MNNHNGHAIAPAAGKLGVLIVGLNGAVATTFIAGTLSIRRRLAKPIGSLTQLGTIRLGKRHENRFPLIKDFVPLADLKDIVFGGWDIRDENCYQSAAYAKVLEERDLAPVREELESAPSHARCVRSTLRETITRNMGKRGKDEIRFGKTTSAGYSFV